MSLRSIAIVAVPALALAACSGADSISMLHPHGLVADAQRRWLIDINLVMAIVVLPVFVLVPLFAWQYRRRNRKVAYRPQWSFSWPLELAVWGVPVLIVAALALLIIYKQATLDPYDRLKATAQPLEVQVVALDWKFLFIYPEQRIATVGPLTIPEGRPVDFHLTSDSTMQSFFIPALGSQIYAMAGMVTRLHLVASTPGTMMGENTQFNGDHFQDEKFDVDVLSRGDFDSPGVGPDYWICAVTLSSLGSTMTGLNFAVTIYKKRAPGMTLMRMPLFCWTALCTSILMIFAMPPLTVATILLALDRYLGAHFFTNDGGGNMMNYANLFWLFGHPEVYILILPSFGIFSEVFPVFSSKRLYGYTSLVIATRTIAVLSFTVWVHHFFTMGQSANVNTAFGIATMLIGIPTGVKIYDWILTMFRGRIRFNVSLLYSLAFIVLFAVGGLTGIILANPGVDYQVHNTVFLVAHFHNVLIPGLLFGMLAGYHYWFPKAFGFRLSEVWGRIAFLLWTFGFLFAFMPLYYLGLIGLPRRTVEYFQGAYLPWTLVAGFGAILVFGALVSTLTQLWVSVRDRDTARVPAGDPWNGRNLEWSMSAPPPEYNFAVLPKVESREAFMEAKIAGTSYRAPTGYEDIEMPRPSIVGPIVGGAEAVCGFGLVWHIWWLAAFALLVVVATVITRSFVRETSFVIPAAKVKEEHEAWLRTVVAQTPVDRDAETSPANHGLAEALAA